MGIVDVGNLAPAYANAFCFAVISQVDFSSV